jgi:hypothetical protein
MTPAMVGFKAQDADGFGSYQVCERSKDGKVRSDVLLIRGQHLREICVPLEHPPDVDRRAKIRFVDIPYAGGRDRIAEPAFGESRLSTPRILSNIDQDFHAVQE